MTVQLQETGVVNQRVLTIGVIRDKVRLLHKCRRKMKLSLIDPDNYKIYAAAHERLAMEINDLCREVGL